MSADGSWRMSIDFVLQGPREQRTLRDYGEYEQDGRELFFVTPMRMATSSEDCWKATRCSSLTTSMGMESTIRSSHLWCERQRDGGTAGRRAASRRDATGCTTA
jgi:hypothetical protein